MVQRERERNSNSDAQAAAPANAQVCVRKYVQLARRSCGGNTCGTAYDLVQARLASSEAHFRIRLVATSVKIHSSLPSLVSLSLSSTPPSPLMERYLSPRESFTQRTVKAWYSMCVSIWSMCHSWLSVSLYSSRKRSPSSERVRYF